MTCYQLNEELTSLVIIFGPPAGGKMTVGLELEQLNRHGDAEARSPG